MDQSGQAVGGMPPVQQAAAPTGETVAAVGGAQAGAAIPPVPTPAPMPSGRGAGRLIETILVVLMFVAAAGFTGLFIWKNIEWEESNRDLEERKAVAVEEAKQEQENLDRIYYEKRLADAYTTFTAPDNYGRLSFRYLKYWSVYVAKDASKGGDFEAYLHPNKIEAVSPTTVYALRVSVLDSRWDTVVKKYDGLVSNGKLDMSTIEVGGKTANRYDGEFSQGINGTMVLIMIRDKVAVLRTDSVEFRPEFETMLDTITYND